MDGPRGRIYQIKGLLEDGPVSASIHTHLDRCLTCRACEANCPSGVQYGQLLDVGRAVAEQRVPRTRMQRMRRRALRIVLPHGRRFAWLLRIGRLLRPLLPPRLRRAVPARIPKPGAWPVVSQARRMAILGGCVQPALAPLTNAAAARVLDRLGISLVETPGCCGALSHHLAATDEALAFARRLVDDWCVLLDQGVEAIVIGASGCAAHVHEYAALLAQDGVYAARAQRVAGRVRELSEVIDVAALAAVRNARAAPRVAVHTPCTLRNALRRGGVVERILEGLGCTLVHNDPEQLCCGSAGSYALLQPELADRLGNGKAQLLQQGGPDVIASSNIGCQMHIGARSRVPVRHWIELVDELVQP